MPLCSTPSEQLTAAGLVSGRSGPYCVRCSGVFVTYLLAVGSPSRTLRFDPHCCTCRRSGGHEFGTFSVLASSFGLSDPGEEGDQVGAGLPGPDPGVFASICSPPSNTVSLSFFSLDRELTQNELVRVFFLFLGSTVLPFVEIVASLVVFAVVGRKVRRASFVGAEWPLAAGDTAHTRSALVDFGNPGWVVNNQRAELCGGTTPF